MSLFYITIVGSWLSPGSHCDALFMVDGVLLDVRNEYLYLAVQSEATEEVLRPVALLEESTATTGAKKKAFEMFKKELMQRLRNLKGD